MDDAPQTRHLPSRGGPAVEKITTHSRILPQLVFLDICQERGPARKMYPLGQPTVQMPYSRYHVGPIIFLC